jgi:hypothetical protein
MQKHSLRPRRATAFGSFLEKNKTIRQRGSNVYSKVYVSTIANVNKNLSDYCETDRPLIRLSGDISTEEKQRRTYGTKELKGNTIE